jgi:hypothetical protein
MAVPALNPVPFSARSPRKIFIGAVQIQAGENFRKNELSLASRPASFMTLNEDARKEVPTPLSTPHIRPDFP